MKAPNTQSIWNALLTAVGVALLGCLGWQMAEISKLKEYVAAEHVTEFTQQNADELRRALTDIMTDIDKRIALIERDIEWVRILGAYKNATPGPAPEPPIPPDEAVEPAPDATPSPSPDPDVHVWEMPKMPSPQQSPRYDVRRRQEQQR